MKFFYFVSILICIQGLKTKRRSLKEKNKQPDLTTVIDEPFEKTKSIEEINLEHGRFSDVKVPEGNKRGLVSLWKDNEGKPRVPYVIKTGAKHNYTTVIKESIRAMNSYMSTCGRDVWVEKNENDTSYVEFNTTLDNGCWSYVGRVGGRQIIAIGEGCNTKGTILHEMLHALGFLHEQQRCDRDSYIEIVKSNIKNSTDAAYDALAQFDCVYSITQTHYSSSYDIFSIMHYDLWAISQKSKRTANTKTIKLKPEFMNLTKDMEELIGRIGRMSDTDKQEVNILYGCIAPTCVVSCNGSNTCASLPPTPNDKMLAEARIIKEAGYLYPGKMIASIKKLEKEFSVYLKIRPNSFAKKLHNVIHLTVGSNKTNSGTEILGVWFSDAGDGSLKITLPAKGKYFNVDPVPLREWCTIDIRQELVKWDYIYTIRINAETVYSGKNVKPQTFENVQVYGSNPWDLVQDAYISNMLVRNGKRDTPTSIDLTINPVDYVGLLSEKVLCENEIFATMAVLEKEYVVSFKLRPLSYSREWESVLHLSKGQNVGECGDRNPAVFFHKDGSGKLYISSAINGNCNSYFITKNPLPLNIWSSIKISQQLTNGVYMYRVDINNENVYKIENRDARSYKDLKVYISDPWYTAHDGDIKELLIYNGKEGALRFSTHPKDKNYIADFWSAAHDDDIKESLVFNKTRGVFDAATQPRDKFNDATKRKLKANGLVATLSVLNPTFSLSFKLKPTSYSKGKHSVFHLLQDQYFVQGANKRVAAWFHEDGSGKLVFTAGFVDAEQNITEYVTKNPLPLKTWSSIKISRSEASSKNKKSYVYSIYLNNKAVFTAPMDTAEGFEFVRVFFSDPWNMAQAGSVKDIQISND